MLKMTGFSDATIWNHFSSFQKNFSTHIVATQNYKKTNMQ